jgi:hypothetical protein
MTLLHAHDDLRSQRGERLFSIATAIGRLAGALTMLHRAIVIAKMRRLRRELMFHAGDGDDASSGRGAARFPQTPLLLGDKWDF